MNIKLNKETIKELLEYNNNLNNTEKDFKNLIHNILKKNHDIDEELKHRIKELNCFYNISELFDKNIPFIEMFENFSNIIWDSLKFPETSSVRIIIEDNCFDSKNFKKYEFYHNVKIISNKNELGLIEFYFDSCSDEFPFTSENIVFFNAIATRISRIIEMKTTENSLKNAYNKLEVKVINRTAKLTKLNKELCIEISERKKTEEKLKEALEKVKTLSGLIPICANCKCIRDDKGFWHEVEIYIKKHSDANFTHGLCPDCRDKLYPELYPKK